ncbi:MAG TPA: response regulator [Bacteroidota bacterium]|nr:response regulator [Bacteroidota bacterium]
MNFESVSDEMLNDLKKKTILFLEDEEELLQTVGQVLGDQGYSVVGIQTGEEALDRLRQLRPDLILADIKLPGIDGFDFYRKIRQIPHCKELPFVYLTAFNSLEAAILAKQEGAAEYITKPFDIEYLVFRIKSLVPLTQSL